MTGLQARELAEWIDQFIDAKIAHALAELGVTKCDATEKTIFWNQCDVAKSQLTDALRRAESTR